MMRHAAPLGMLYVFIQSMTSLSSIIFLVGPGNHLASVVILDADIGSYSRIAHLVDALLATTLSILTLAENAPSEQWSLPQFAPTLENCHKAIRTSFLNRRDAQQLDRLCSLIAGSSVPPPGREKPLAVRAAGYGGDAGWPVATEGKPGQWPSGAARPLPTVCSTANCDVVAANIFCHPLRRHPVPAGFRKTVGAQ